MTLADAADWTFFAATVTNATPATTDFADWTFITFASGGGGGDGPNPPQGSTTSCGSGSAGSMTINAPATIVAGNLLVAVVTAGINGGGAWTAPSGWVSGGADTNNFTTQVFGKVATASEPASYTFTLGVGASYVGSIVQYSGATAFDNSLFANHSSSPNNAAQAPSITPVANLSTWVTWFTTGSGLTFTTPSGLTLRNSCTAGPVLYMFDKQLTGNAATGVANSTISSSLDNWQAGSFLVKQ